MVQSIKTDMIDRSGGCCIPWSHVITAYASNCSDVPNSRCNFKGKLKLNDIEWR